MRLIWAAAWAVCVELVTVGATWASDDSPQAIYNAAQAAFDKADWAGSKGGFEKLIPADPSQPLSHSQAVIAGRLASALEHLGRFDQAQVMAKRAIMALPPNDLELSVILNTAGDAARFSFDYPAAVALYERALSVAKLAGDADAVLVARVNLAYAETTINPGAVAAELDQALTDKVELTKRSKLDRAVIEDLRARAAANAGDVANAKLWADRAMSDSGGLTDTVSLLQSAIRNDAAIIAALRKDGEGTRRYLTYTGAGHLKDMNWIGSVDGELPLCAKESDIRPSDNVVVQFSIADDGHVMGAMPIYASRPGEIGATFAQAVNEWRWDPQQLQGVDPFWRNSLVLELRCSSRPTPTSLEMPVREMLADWLSTKGVKMSDRFGDLVHADDPRLRSTGPEAISVLFTRAQKMAGGEGMFARLQTVLDANGAPPSAYALLTVDEARAESHGSDPRQHAASRAAYLAKVVPDLRSRYPDDPAIAWLLLDWAQDYEDSGDFKTAKPILQQILDMPKSTLPEDAPVRSVALLHKAIGATRLGNSADLAELAESGLTSEECSMYDTHPIPTSMPVSGSLFPAEAQSWGFEGYVRVSFDIADDGHVANPRAVLAYPPFVFGESTEKMALGFRYVPPKIGEKLVGCVGQTQPVNYRLVN